jgi:hypothetical protein
MNSSTLQHLPQQPARGMTPRPQTRHPGPLGRHPASPWYLRPLLGALVGLLLTVGTSQAGWVSVAPQDFTRLCPQHTGGDREYAGHGPRVDVRGELYTAPNLRDLVLHLTMTQQETRSDWSRADLDRTFVLYTAPVGQQIRYIYNASIFALSYVDTDHAVDTFYFSSEANIFRALEIMGDTSGNDIGNCTADDAYLSAYGTTLWVWVE